mmetsp:Transcript_20136/g.63056  ORF Transcript_20136/g.63056 Transcript_20136/m.63056 type:complete len:92 (-) Transcript_20136:57-332(-)
MCSAHEGFDCVGSAGDLLDHGEAKSPAECCAACRANKACGAWTWNKNTTSDQHHCFLKADCKTVRELNGTTAGALKWPKLGAKAADRVLVV